MERTWKPVVAGVLDIVSGILWIVSVGFIGLVGLALYAAFGSELTPAREALAWLFFAALALPGAMAIVGGIFAVRRRVWGVALAGSICACLSIIGVLALVLVALSRSEFRQPARVVDAEQPHGEGT